MLRNTNRTWLPNYCNPNGILPKIQETRALFSHRPYAFSEFVGKAVAFLKSDEVRKMGFEYVPERTLPCKWKCADESIYSAELALYAQTGHFPFDKGKLGGRFNEASLGAAVHHGEINLDFGGSHVGYVPGDDGGSFGTIWRPQRGVTSTDCGYLSALIAPFGEEYEDAKDNVLVYRPAGEEAIIVSLPNEFLQPNWSDRPIKLLVDVDSLTKGEVEFAQHKRHTHTPIARSLFYLSDSFLEELPPGSIAELVSETPTPIGKHLSHPYFNIFDINAPLDAHGLPQERLLLYMKHILAARYTPPALMAAIINTNVEHNHLTDTIRGAQYQAYAFASYSGLFIDMYDARQGCYANLFMPLALAIKPAGAQREVELLPDEIHDRFELLVPAEPAIPMKDVLRIESFDALVDQFTFVPTLR